MSSKASILSKTVGQQIILDASLTKIGSVSQVSLFDTPAAVTVATGSATLSTAQTISGLIAQTPAANSTLTLPTAAALEAIFPNASIGASFDLRVLNLAPATFNTTIAADAGSSLIGNGVIPPASARLFRIRFTNVSAGTEAYVAYAL